MTARIRPRIILVHGAWVGAWEFGPLVQILRERGWEVDALDLPSTGTTGSMAIVDSTLSGATVLLANRTGTIEQVVARSRINGLLVCTANNPAPIKSVQPKYTSEAMRAKIQGSVEIEAVVLPNGTIGDVRILKPLDKQYGLDQEAIVAAKQWLFRPGTDKDGKPIPVIVTIILEFRLH